jgi:hypothetical protein
VATLYPSMEYFQNAPAVFLIAAAMTTFPATSGPNDLKYAVPSALKRTFSPSSLMKSPTPRSAVSVQLSSFSRAMDRTGQVFWICSTATFAAPRVFDRPSASKLNSMRSTITWAWRRFLVCAFCPTVISTQLSTPPRSASTMLPNVQLTIPASLGATITSSMGSPVRIRTAVAAKGM